MLGFWPTPVHPLERLSSHLGGPRIFVKRDDQSGLALGGNKTRKLEYLLAEAVSQGCDTLITAGAAQSNHCRQTAAAAARCGLRCHLLLGGTESSLVTGNLLLDKLFGAEIHWAGNHRKGELLPQLAETVRASGGMPYVVPYGGSNEIGTLGFVNAAGEFQLQLTDLPHTIDHIVFATSSGGTQAGLLIGKSLYGLDQRLIGIGVEKPEVGHEPLDTRILAIAEKTARLLRIEKMPSAVDVILFHEFSARGYGVVGDDEREAIRLLASTEGILLDPVYTARAMAGLISLIRAGEFRRDEGVLFWHTGGAPALFAYENELMESPGVQVAANSPTGP
jgi:D-cysteine desulfhydrase